MKQVVIKVRDGIVDPVTIPQGVEVVIRDYDLSDTIENELVQTDTNGDNFVEIIFDETEYA